MVETRIGNGRSSLKVLVKNSGLYSVGNVAIKAIGFFLIPLYTRVMSPEDYGIIGFTTALGQIISPVISLGLISSMPILYYSYDPDERNRLISTVFNFSIVYSLVVTLAILIAWGSIFSHFAAKVSFNPYIILCVVTVFFSGFYWLPLGIFNMEERAAAYSIYSVSLSLLGVLLTIVMVLLLSLKAFGVLLAGAIASSIGMISVLL